MEPEKQDATCCPLNPLCNNWHYLDDSGINKCKYRGPMDLCVTRKHSSYSNDEIRNMTDKQYEVFNNNTSKEIGVASLYIMKGKSCNYCGRIGIHEITCRNPWDLTK